MHERFGILRNIYFIGSSWQYKFSLFINLEIIGFVTLTKFFIKIYTRCQITRKIIFFDFLETSYNGGVTSGDTHIEIL